MRVISTEHEGAKRLRGSGEIPGMLALRGQIQGVLPKLCPSNLDPATDETKFVFAKTVQILFPKPAFPYQHAKDHGKDRMPVVVFFVNLLAPLAQVVFQLPQI
jgi:hypothetical protein